MPNIKQDFIPDLPKLPYEKGVGNYIGVVAHCTGNYGDKGGDEAKDERAWEVKNWHNAFVHFFCDWNEILQVADIQYKAYGAGPKANGKYVHVELCQTKDETLFKKSYENYIWTLAYVLFKKNLPVVDGKTLVSHKWVSDKLGGTNHQDPIAYLAEHGLSWNDVVIDTRIVYNRMKTPVVPKITTEVAVEFICKKIKSKYVSGWKKKAASVQYLDTIVMKIATQWMADNKEGFEEVTKVPPILPTLENALAFIDSKIHLSDLNGWMIKAKNVDSLDEFFKKIAYVWQKEGQE